MNKNNNNEAIQSVIDYVDKTDFDSIAELKATIIKYFKKTITDDDEALKTLIKMIDDMRAPTLTEAKASFINFFRSFKESEQDE